MKTVFPILILFFFSIMTTAFPPAVRYNPVQLMQARPDPGQVWKFSAFGDNKKGVTVLNACIARSNLVDTAVFALHTGDLVESDGAANWDLVENNCRVQMDRLPIWPCIGNHEGIGLNYKVYFSLPDNGITGHYGDYYSFEYKNALFICLAPYNGASGVMKGNDAQFQWLISQLSSCNKEHIFVWFHEPCYTVGHKTTVGGARYSGSGLTVADLLGPVFTQFKVTAVFGGHDHIYYHTKRNSVDYFISAGAGAGLYPLDHTNEAIAGDVYNNTHNHYVLLSVDGQKVTYKTKSVTSVFTVLDSGTIYNNRASIQDRTRPHAEGPLLSLSPNPFNPVTTLVYRVPGHITSQKVIISVFDVNGRHIHTPIDCPHLPGQYQVQWYPKSRVPSGIYIFRLKYGRQIHEVRAIFLK